MRFPVVDLFAGPGGLGEGFSRCRTARFEIALSIEKDEAAFETLRLRAAFRCLSRLCPSDSMTWALWDKAIAETPWNILFDSLRESSDPRIQAACTQATSEAWHVELGPGTRGEVLKRTSARLGDTRFANSRDRAVVIGGPPCQAYSVVGRSRHKGSPTYKPHADSRHFLYREYLEVLAAVRPAVFIMENVKGLLSSRMDEQLIFDSITDDLKRPDLASGADSGLTYVLVSLDRGTSALSEAMANDFVVRAENFGVPQARHRLIVCGVRKDVFESIGKAERLARSVAPTVEQAIGDLPRLRSGVSYRGNGASWSEALDTPDAEKALAELARSPRVDLQDCGESMRLIRKQLAMQQDPGRGSPRSLASKLAELRPGALEHWYRDRASRVIANHETRSHMPSDLLRYWFASTFACVTGRSPKLADFPASLLPKHKNVLAHRPQDAIFKDRFRVQVRSKASTTVTSHIGKDGHAFIHPDPFQCRSLTVREAARLQTFPDSYVFLGNRTSQYTQVGNAVPPYLAYQIANVVGRLLMLADRV